MGTIVEIYADRVETKAVGFYNGKWIPRELYTFDYGTAPNYGKLTFENSAALRNILAAKLDGKEISSEYTVAWYLNGEIVSMENSLLLSDSLMNEGDKVAVRITDSDGKYQSALSQAITAVK